jgi:hypothetical protein
VQPGASRSWPGCSATTGRCRPVVAARRVTGWGDADAVFGHLDARALAR